MKYLDIIEDISNEMNIPVEVVNEAYKSYWKFIRETAQSLPLKEDLTQEDFNNLRTSFNVPSIGKLCVTWNRYLGMKKRLSYIKNLITNAEDKED